MDYEFMCSLCTEPVALESASTDENGQPVHEDCYIRSLVTSTEYISPERLAS